MLFWFLKPKNILSRKNSPGDLQNRQTLRSSAVLRALLLIQLDGFDGGSELAIPWCVGAPLPCGRWYLVGDQNDNQLYYLFGLSWRLTGWVLTQGTWGLWPSPLSHWDSTSSPSIVPYFDMGPQLPRQSVDKAWTSDPLPLKLSMALWVEVRVVAEINLGRWLKRQWQCNLAISFQVRRYKTLTQSHVRPFYDAMFSTVKQTVVVIRITKSFVWNRNKLLHLNKTKTKKYIFFFHSTVDDFPSQGFAQGSQRLFRPAMARPPSSLAWSPQLRELCLWHLLGIELHEKQWALCVGQQK